MHEVMSPTACSACLDSRQCWVCLGIGTTEDRRGHRLACDACERTGECRRCAVPRQGR
jgi:hypothetical protein